MERYSTNLKMWFEGRVMDTTRHGNFYAMERNDTLEGSMQPAPPCPNADARS